jgi:hypothetical protein
MNKDTSTKVLGKGVESRGRELRSGAVDDDVKFQATVTTIRPRTRDVCLDAQRRAPISSRWV